MKYLFRDIVKDNLPVTKTNESSRNDNKCNN